MSWTRLSLINNVRRTRTNIQTKLSESQSNTLMRFNLHKYVFMRSKGIYCK